MIPRFAEEIVYGRLTSLHKVILILGARQVGKTTLLRSLQNRLKREGKVIRYLNCDLEEDRQAANTTSSTLIDRLVSGIDAIFIDEIQRVDNPGLTLKILIDRFPRLWILATGSSSLDLRSKVVEFLTGRYVDILLYPLSLMEVLKESGNADDPSIRQYAADALLSDVLRYGLYPEIYLEANPATKELLLSKLVESYLFKDILAFQRIRFSQIIVDLARALAYQMGSEVSENELARRLKIDHKTVLSYMDILEKSFVIKRLPAFSRNPRREIGKLSKVYFLDPGIRNALIGDFKDLSIRPDRGALWENFIITERAKLFANRGETIEGRFWRTYGGAEVDYIEETGASDIRAYEIKSGTSTLSRGAESFKRAYGLNVQLVNQENYVDFILGN